MKQRPRPARIASACLLLGLLALAPAAGGSDASVAEDAWPLANHDLSSTRSAPASGIDRTTVGSLRVAWRFRFHTRPGAAFTSGGGSSATISTLRPESWSIRAAWSTDRPTVLTITTARGAPDETPMITVDPGVTGVPGIGVWSATIPAARSRVGRR